MRQHTTQSRWNSAYLLVVVGLIALLNAYDRSLITILVTPMKRDLDLSDTQIGLLSGLVYALPYSLMGIPLARMADRVGRAKTMGSVLFIWSLATVVSGRAINFTTMLLCRAAVGGAEAGSAPSAYALIGDRFGARSRGRAISFVAVCGAVGYVLALALGGAVADRWGWRAAFYVGGAPGILLALLTVLTLRDIRPAAAPRGSTSAESLGSVLRTLWGRKSYVLLMVGISISAVGGYGHNAWDPAFLMRKFHTTPGVIGAYYSLVVGPAAIVSIFAGGFLNDWLIRRDARWSLWMIALAFGIALPAVLAFPWVNSLPLALALALVNLIAVGFWTAPAFALLQSLAESRSRAVASAVFLTTTAIVGPGVGPSLTGAMSDAFRTRFGDESLAVSLTLVGLTYIVGIGCFLLATKSVGADLIEVGEADAAGTISGENRGGK